MNDVASFSIIEDYYNQSLSIPRDSAWQSADTCLGQSEAVEEAKSAAHEISVVLNAQHILSELRDLLVDAKNLFNPPNEVVRVKRLSTTATIPTRGSASAIGLDLYADLLDGRTPSDYQPELRLAPGRRSAVPTSIAIAIPSGFYARVAPRSGLALKNGIVVLGGVVDEDYRGEVKVILLNTSDELFTIKHGDRIGQLILERAEILPVLEVTDLDETERGEAGFGSTGV